jgi:hypothetical protein
MDYSPGFGQHPEELAAALEHNDGAESTYRRLGATIIDGTRPHLHHTRGNQISG